MKIMDFRLPELGEGVYEAELVAWLVKPGDRIKRGQNLMEVLTDKATMEVPAPFAGVIESLLAEPGQAIKVGEKVLSYKTKGDKDGAAAIEDGNQKAEKNNAEHKRPQETQMPVTQTLSRAGERVLTSVLGIKAAPSVRHMARKLGVDLAEIHGSGPGGRVLIEDLSAHMQPGRAPGAQSPPESPLDFGKPGTRVKL